MEPTTEQLMWMYETMLLVREYEETMAKVYLEGKLPPNIQKGLAFDIGSGPVPGEMHLRPDRSRWRWVCVRTCARKTPSWARTGRTTLPLLRACRSIA